MRERRLIVGGAEWSTLSHDAFPALRFEFMLAGPHYLKSWKKDLEAVGGRDGSRDPRLKVIHPGKELSPGIRSGNGEMLFLERSVQLASRGQRLRAPPFTSGTNPSLIR